jgi:arylsulfatase A-like enzyme
MGLREWANRTASRVQEEGTRGVKDSLYELYEGVWRKAGWHVPRGTNIYERDWDTLIILDACRVDLMREVAGDYRFINEVGSFESVGSMSEEWMWKTFTDEYADEMSRTAHVTGNVFTEEVVDEGDFQTLDEVWRYAWDDETGTIPPEAVTDRAIDVARNQSPDRLIVHYMQPHHPFIGEKQVEIADADPFGREGNLTAVDALRRGDLSRDEFWTAYRSNLDEVLEHVSTLLDSHDANRVVITSDHGDALGEWGIYDHPAGFLHPVVTNVPWVETSASDSGEYTPDLKPENGTITDVESRLESLGYI